MTPNAIEILIYCYISQSRHPRYDAPAVQEELTSMVQNGLIEPVEDVDNTYRTTSRGAAHIEQLCGIKWPMQKWVDEWGRII